MRTNGTWEDGRIALIQSDIWIGFPRAEQVLARLQSLIEAPRQTRMPGLLVHGASGIGKTMIARNLSRRYAPEYNSNWALLAPRFFCFRRLRPLTSGGFIYISSPR